MHSTLPMHANQFVASPELECSDSSTHSIPVLYQIWALPSVQILIPFWMIALPAWPQDMVHIDFRCAACRFGSFDDTASASPSTMSAAFKLAADEGGRQTSAVKQVCDA